MGGLRWPRAAPGVEGSGAGRLDVKEGRRLGQRNGQRGPGPGILVGLRRRGDEIPGRRDGSGRSGREAAAMNRQASPTFKNILHPRELGSFAEDQQRPVSAVPTPLPGWNAVCGSGGGRRGLAHGWHIIVGGATNHGKTLLGLNLRWGRLPIASGSSSRRPDSRLSHYLSRTLLERCVPSSAWCRLASGSA